MDGKVIMTADVQGNLPMDDAHLLIAYWETDGYYA